MRKFTIGGKTIDLVYSEKTLEFDPAVPYLYVPPYDFAQIALQINSVT